MGNSIVEKFITVETYQALAYGILHALIVIRLYYRQQCHYNLLLVSSVTATTVQFFKSFKMFLTFSFCEIKFRQCRDIPPRGYETVAGPQMMIQRCHSVTHCVSAGQHYGIKSIVR